MNQSNDRSKLQEQIDLNLKRVYQEALEQELPDKFKALLEELAKKDDKK